MKKSSIVLIIALLFSVSLCTLTSCRENKTTVEKMEEEIDDVGDDIEEGIEEIEDEVDDATDDN